MPSGEMLSAMQLLPGSDGLRNGTLADWQRISGFMKTLNSCVLVGEAPDKALRNRDAWLKAVDGCITAALECYPSAIQAAISRSDAALLASIGETLSYCISITHGCLKARPAWLCLQQQQQHGLQRSVEALAVVGGAAPNSLRICL